MDAWCHAASHPTCRCPPILQGCMIKERGVLEPIAMPACSGVKVRPPAACQRRCGVCMAATPGAGWLLLLLLIALPPAESPIFQVLYLPLCNRHLPAGG